MTSRVDTITDTWRVLDEWEAGLSVVPAFVVGVGKRLAGMDFELGLAGYLIIDS